MIKFKHIVDIPIVKNFFIIIIFMFYDLSLPKTKSIDNKTCKLNNIRGDLEPEILVSILHKKHLYYIAHFWNHYLGILFKIVVISTIDKAVI